MRALQRNLYSALSSHRCIASLDEALSAGDFQALLAITNTHGFEGLFDGNGVTAKNQECDHQTNFAGAAFSDTPLEILHADLISAYEKELMQTDSSSCIREVSFSDTELGTDVWPRLKVFTLERDETASKQVLFMCNYCKQSIKIDKMPPRCVLNGLETVEIKAPLAKLDRLSR